MNGKIVMVVLWLEGRTRPCALAASISFLLNNLLRSETDLRLLKDFFGFI